MCVQQRQLRDLVIKTVVISLGNSEVECMVEVHDVGVSNTPQAAKNKDSIFVSHLQRVASLAQRIIMGNPAEGDAHKKYSVPIFMMCWVQSPGLSAAETLNMSRIRTTALEYSL